MAKKNSNLVCTRITATTKSELEFIKSTYGLDPRTKQYSKSDYAALGQLVTTEYNRCMEALSTTK
jgi:hypothetical protein